MKQLFSLLFILAFAFIQSSAQTYTFVTDDQGCEFTINLDSTHNYELIITGSYKSAQPAIRPSFNPGGQDFDTGGYAAKFKGSITYYPNGTTQFDWPIDYCNHTFFQVSNLNMKYVNKWQAFNAKFDITNISKSGSYPFRLNNNMDFPFGGLIWKSGTTISVIQK
jgi:hypothetical protein